ncbi:hypothetical protein GLOIN_2v1687904, partial [Rhizophagus irregularis DAOM 181602=DAOM 197198]
SLILLQMIASFSKLTRLNIGLNRFVNENYLTFYIDNFLVVTRSFICYHFCMTPF